MALVGYDWMGEACQYCGAKAGELHKVGCRAEVCPNCGKRLASCGHLAEVKRSKIDRIPFIQRAITCATCGRLFPRLFKVEKEDWEKYVIPPLQHKIICLKCYNQMKELFPNGWKQMSI